MSKQVAIAILCAALLHALWNVLISSSADKSRSTLLVAGGAALWSACVLPFAALPAGASWPYLAASVAIHVLYFSLVARLYDRAEVSFGYPIMRGSAPAVSALAAAALVHESPTANGWTGVLLVSLGILVLAGDARRSGAFPFSPALLALANAGVIVLYTLVDGVGARLSGHPASYTAWLFFLTALPLLLLHLRRHGGKGVRELALNWDKGLVGGACTAGSYAIALWAMTRAPIALVAALRETSVVFGTMLAAGFLGEKVSPMRYLSVALVTGGAVAIKLS